jgi:hypothetical protein
MDCAFECCSFVGIPFQYLADYVLVVRQLGMQKEIVAKLYVLILSPN